MKIIAGAIAHAMDYFLHPGYISAYGPPPEPPPPEPPPPPPPPSDASVEQFFGGTGGVEPPVEGFVGSVGGSGFSIDAFLASGWLPLIVVGLLAFFIVAVATYLRREPEVGDLARGEPRGEFF